jgi:hypothetical protein
LNVSPKPNIFEEQNEKIQKIYSQFNVSCCFSLNVPCQMLVIH